MKNKLTKKEILVIQGTSPEFLSQDQIGGLSQDQIGWLSQDQIGWLSQDQIGWLSQDQIGWLSQDQIGWLSQDQIGGLSRYQIGGLSQDQIGWLSQDQIGWLSQDQIGWLSQDQIGWLSQDQIGGLSQDQIGWLPEKTIKKILALKKECIWEKPYTKLLKAITASGNRLIQSSWHTCETAHCVAGWTVTLAPHGKELEQKIGTGPAARLILRSSRPDAPLPRFDGNADEDAILAFIEARAEEEK